MKIIEALKKVKENKQKINDLKQKISLNCARHNHETPLYPDADLKIAAWAQSCEDLGQENIRLLNAIARTNLQTMVTIELPLPSGPTNVTKSIAEWIWRRREYAASDLGVWSSMTDRNLKEGKAPSSTGVDMDVKIVRAYNPELRDAKRAMYVAEPQLINAKMEVINAITDLLE